MLLARPKRRCDCPWASPSEGSRYWCAWELGTPQVPAHRQSHSQFTAPVWKYEHPFCLPTVLGPATHTATSPLSLVPGPNRWQQPWEPAEKWPQTRWWHKKLSLLEADRYHCPSYFPNRHSFKKKKKWKEETESERSGGKRSMQKMLWEWGWRLDIV